MKGTAVIVGAGIAGLAAARSLAINGWDVEVRERAPALPTAGTMLGLWPAALQALEEIGVGPQVRAQAVRVEPSPDTGLRTPAGRTLVRTAGGSTLALISRPALLSAMADGVNVTLGSEVAGMDSLAGAEAVIGADGTFSSVRTALFGERARARTFGAVVWRGTVPGTVASHGETWAPGAMFGITPAGPDATNWYACLNAPGPFSPPHLQHLRDVFGSWRTGASEVLSRVEEDSILHHELFEAPPLPSYVSGTTALIGDAAHSMGPFLGRGACEALIDGAVLGRCLGGAQTVAEGLAEYERARHGAARRVATMSHWMGRFAMMPRGFRGRNAALVAVGSVMRVAERFRGRAVWLGDVPPDGPGNGGGGDAEGR